MPVVDFVVCWVGCLSLQRGAELRRCPAGLRCGRSRCAGLLCGARPGQVAARLALRAQTCSPSPCHRQGADLPCPARLRRPQGAPPYTAFALMHRWWHATVAGPRHATSGATQGLRRLAAGRLEGAEKRSGEVGARSALQPLTRRRCLSAAPEGREASSAAPPRREHRRAVPPQAGPPERSPAASRLSPRPALLRQTETSDDIARSLNPAPPPQWSSRSTSHPSTPRPGPRTAPPAPACAAAPHAGRRAPGRPHGPARPLRRGTRSRRCR